jgi:hypothetical protein
LIVRLASVFVISRLPLRAASLAVFSLEAVARNWPHCAEVCVEAALSLLSRLFFAGVVCPSWWLAAACSSWRWLCAVTLAGWVGFARDVELCCVFYSCSKRDHSFARKRFLL